MKKAFLCILFILILSLVSCKDKDDNPKEEYNWPYTQKVAILSQDDGWYYTFSHSYYEEEDNDSGLIPFNFFAINLRYRYNDAYMTTEKVVVDDKVVDKVVPQTVQILGASNSEEIKNDMYDVAELLKYDGGEVTKEELLELTVDDIEFEELDEGLFIGLMKTALNSEPHKEGKYAEIPSYALLTEPEYLSNYKFQIGFLNYMGCIDVIYIDVLYKTGSEYDAYIQLSDMVDSGEASEEQLKLFEKIQDISKGIVEENNFTYKEDGENVIADVDISRLYNFLTDIENSNYTKYIVMQ